MTSSDDSDSSEYDIGEIIQDKQKSGLIEQFLRTGIRMELEKHANFIFKNAVEHFSTNHKELPEQIISIDEEQEAS